jgi:hypothetical protein
VATLRARLTQPWHTWKPRAFGVFTRFSSSQRLSGAHLLGNRSQSRVLPALVAAGCPTIGHVMAENWTSDPSRSPGGPPPVRLAR